VTLSSRQPPTGVPASFRWAGYSKRPGRTSRRWQSAPNGRDTSP